MPFLFILVINSTVLKNIAALWLVFEAFVCILILFPTVVTTTTTVALGGRSPVNTVAN